MTERTAIINGVTLTEAQLREGLRQIETPRFKAGDKFRRPHGGVWTVLDERQAEQWRKGAALSPFMLAAMDEQGGLLQFYEHELPSMERVQ